MIKKLYNKTLEYISSGWLFFIVIMMVSIIIFSFKSKSIAYFIFSFNIIITQIIPVMFLVFAIIFIINLFADYKKIAKYLGQKSGIIGWLAAIIGGVISTGPIYAWYPMLQDLQDKNMRTGLISTFLYNRAIKIPLMPMFAFYFGWPILIAMTILMIIFSVINGLILEIIIGKNYKP